MPAYFIAVKNGVKDQAEMDTYAAKGANAMGDRDFKLLALYGRIRSTDGPDTEGCVIVEFPTFEEAEAWYDSPAYQDAVQHRIKGGDYQTFIVEGL